MNRLMVSFCLLVSLNFLPSAHAADFCDTTGVCQHFIPMVKLPPVQAQQTMVWCWAASAQTIFRYYGHEISQRDIVTHVFGTDAVTSGPPDAILKMLNSSYVDAAGNTFTVSTPKYEDTYGWMPGNFAVATIHPTLTNADIFQELSLEHPIFYADGPHAMVLVNGMEHMGIPIGGYVLDPAPTVPAFIGPITAPNVPAVGLRQLTPYEMHAFFAAEVVVQ